MGQKALGLKLPQYIQDFKTSQWIQSNNNNCKGSELIGYPKQYTNIKNYNKIDQYHVTIKSYSQLNKCLEIFLWRQNHQFITKAYYLVPKFVNQICTQNHNEVDIYVQHVTWRLSQIKDIPFPENIYCAICMLRGYSLLYQNYGRFQIAQEQVCIDLIGKVTVWFNSNLSHFEKQQKSHKFSFGKIWNKYNSRNSINLSQSPHHNKQQNAQKREQQQQIVGQIMKMIINNTDHQTEPKPSLSEYYQSYKLSNQANFEGTLRMFEQYIENSRIKVLQDDINFDTQFKIPDRMQSVILLNMLKLANRVQKLPSNSRNKKQSNLNSRPQYKNIAMLKTDRISATQRNRQNNKNYGPTAAHQKRPITNYCQSVPNRKHLNSFQNIPSHHNLHKNKSSQNFNNIPWINSPIFKQGNQISNNQKHASSNYYDNKSNMGCQYNSQKNVYKNVVYNMHTVHNTNINTDLVFKNLHNPPKIYSDRNNPKKRIKTIDSTETEALPIIPQRQYINYSTQPLRYGNQIQGIWQGQSINLEKIRQPSIHINFGNSYCVNGKNGANNNATTNNITTINNKNFTKINNKYNYNSSSRNCNNNKCYKTAKHETATENVKINTNKSIVNYYYQPSKTVRLENKYKQIGVRTIVQLNSKIQDSSSGIGNVNVNVNVNDNINVNSGVKLNTKSNNTMNSNWNNKQMRGSPSMHTNQYTSQHTYKNSNNEAGISKLSRQVKMNRKGCLRNRQSRNIQGMFRSERNKNYSVTVPVQAASAVRKYDDKFSYFSINGKQHRLDQDIAQDLQAYNI